MKRLFTFLALCCLVVTGVSAISPTDIKVSDATTTYYYYVKSANNYYWYDDLTSNFLKGTNSSGSKTQFAFYKSGTGGQLYIYSKASGKYLNFTGPDWNNDNSSKDKLSYETTATTRWSIVTGVQSNYVGFRPSDTSSRFINGQAQIGSYSGTGANSSWTIEGEESTTTPQAVKDYLFASPATDVCVTFTNSGATWEGVGFTVNATDADGNAVENVTASASGTSNPKNLNVGADKLGINYQTSGSGSLTLNFNISNLPAGSSFNCISLPMYAVNSGGNYQGPDAGTSHINVTVTVKEGETTLYTGTMENFNITEQKNGNLNSGLVFNSDSPITIAGTSATVSFTISNGTTNNGCYMALQSLNLTTEGEEPAPDDPDVEVPETGYYYIKEGGEYLYNDFVNSASSTQKNSTKQAYDNGYVWHVTSTEGSTTVTLLNGEGSGYNSTSPNDIDLSGKDWTFEEYDTSIDIVVPVRIRYGTLEAYVPMPFEDASASFINNNTSHNGGFFTYKKGTSISIVSLVASSGNSITTTSPDGTEWEDQPRIFDGFNAEQKLVELYYYTKQDTERYLDIVNKCYSVFYEHVGKPGYCIEINEDYVDPEGDLDFIKEQIKAVGEMVDEYGEWISRDDVIDILKDYIEPYQAKYILGALNNYIKTLEIAQPVQGDAYLIAVRGNDYTGSTKYYLKNDGSYTDNEAEADVFVLGGSGDETCASLLVTNNNPGTEGGIHYLQIHADGVNMNTEYKEADNALNLVSMTKAEGDNIDSCPAYLYGTFSATNKEGKVMTFDETGGGSWVSDAGDLWMKNDKTSAIELIPVEYPYNKPKLAVGNPDEHEGSYASIWLPYPMMFPDGVEVYRATDVENDGILILKQVNSDTMVAAGGYIIRDPNKSTSMTVLPAPAAPDDVTPDTDNAFVGSTEDPLNVEVDNSWDAFAANYEGTAYVLAKKNNVIGYYKYNDAKNRLPKGKAIWFSKYSSDANCMQFSFGDIISAIEALHGNTTNAEIFDLQGRRLDKAEKGQVNVINGKKVMFK